MKMIPGDWLMNAGMVGYLRMCRLAGRKESDLSKGFIEITPADLKGFTDLYFAAVLMRIAKGKFRLGYKLFADVRSKVNDKQFREIRSKFAELEERSIREIKPNYNAFDLTLRSIIKKLEYFKKQAAALCDKELIKYPELEKKNIQKTKKQIDKQISNQISSLRNKNLNFVYIYLQSFYRNKNVIANPASKSRKKSFQIEYVGSAIKQLNSHHTSTEGFLCRFCKQNRVVPKEFYDVNSMFAEGMFSTTAVTISFRNFFYNMQPDLFVCDVCELFLICAWAGFTEIPYRFRDDVYDTDYIFVNLPSLELLWYENEKIQELFMMAGEDVQDTVYQDIIQDIFLRENRAKAKWSLANILFIEIKTTRRKDVERPDFRYFHISEDIAKLFLDQYASKAFSYIGGKVEIGNGISVNLRRNVIARILDHDSMFPLCYSLLTSYLKERDQYSLRNVFNISLISSIRGSIIGGAKRGVDDPMLESKQVYGILKGIQNEGSTFVNAITYDTRKRKSYVLLSMIRNNRIEDFYDILIKIYISENKPIPESLIGLLNTADEVGFQPRAYAFMSGFLGDKDNQQG